MTSSDPFNTSSHPYINSIIADPSALSAWRNTWSDPSKSPAPQIPDALLNIYKDIALKQTAPAYEQDLAGTNAAVSNDITNTGNEYQNQVDNLNNQLTVDTRNLNENEGENGTWASSARNERLASLNNSYNAKYNTAYNTAVNSNNQNLIQGEGNLGAKMDPYTLQKSNLTSYGVGAGGVQPTGSYKYNPFGGYGSINSNYQSNAGVLGRNYIAGQFQNINP